MARSIDAAIVVLDSLQALFELGDRQHVGDQEILEALRAVGVTGFSEDHAGYLATLGIVLRLMLRHCEADPQAMFAATRTDLGSLGADIDDQAFEAIVRDLEP